MADPAPMIGPGLFFALSPGPCFRGPPGVEKNSLEKDSRGSNFLEGEEVVCDVEVLSSRFFHEGRVDSWLDSCDFGRSGLGLSPVGVGRLPLKEQGHLTRLGIDGSNPGFGLILGDFAALNCGDRCVASFERPAGARFFS